MAHLSVFETLESRVSVQNLISVCSRHWRAGSQCSVLVAHLSVLETLESKVLVQCAHDMYT